MLVYNPKNQCGKFTKWQVQWVGPYVVENKLNQANYVVGKGRGKPVVIHIDRLRKLPTEMNSDNAECPVSDSSPTSQPNKRRKADDAAMATSTHCTEIVSCTDSELSRPSTRSTVTVSSSNQDSNVCNNTDSPDTSDCYPAVTVSQSTDTAADAAATAQSAATPVRPRPASTSRPARVHRRPARFLETVQARGPCKRNYAARARCRLAGTDISAASYS